MTLNFDNVYINNYATVAGLMEKEGSFGKLYDRVYDNYYIEKDTFEQAEMKMIKDSTSLSLIKANKSISDINVIVGSDLSNQIAINSYSSIDFDKPYLGVYSACASFCEEILIASLLLQNKKINNVLINTSSHNMTSEREFRNPVEYGYPKPKRSTYTVTGATSVILSNEKSNIKIKSATIGKVVDMKITDAFNMGAVMAPAAGDTLYSFLKDTKTNINDYDLVLTGDLGVYGKKILKDYMNIKYNIKLGKNYEDSASIIYNRKKQKIVNAGGSGPACISLVFLTDIINKMKEKKLKKVLLIATGALMNTTMNNQKLSIPAISHLISLESV